MASSSFTLPGIDLCGYQHTAMGNTSAGPEYVEVVKEVGHTGQHVHERLASGSPNPQVIVIPFLDARVGYFL